MLAACAAGAAAAGVITGANADGAATPGSGAGGGAAQSAGTHGGGAAQKGRASASARTRPPRVAPAARVSAARVPAAKLLGQRIMVGFSGTSADGELLRRVRAGEVGAVILFAENIVDRPQVKALTRSLQAAARAGGNPPLLIAVDQEGGQVRRFPGGPPNLSEPQIAQSGSAAVAAREGRHTGNYLRGLGVNMDLAPVLDVPSSSRSFIWQQGRAYSFDPAAVARYGTAFALAVQSQHVAATGKHFPGVGTATADTDNQLDVLYPTASQRAGALAPYRSLIPRGLDAVMVSTAAYPAYDASRAPAALSPRIATELLRRRLGFRGVSITDALGTPTGHDETTAGALAARAGVDVLLYTDSAPGELGALEAALRSGRISRAAAAASYERIVALKRRLGP